MSRPVGQPTRVRLTDGTPAAFLVPGTRDVVRFTGVLDHWREWFGVLDGELERILFRWDD